MKTPVSSCIISVRMYDIYIYDILITNKTIDNIFYMHYTLQEILNNYWPWKIKCTWIVGWIVEGAFTIMPVGVKDNF